MDIKRVVFYTQVPDKYTWMQSVGKIKDNYTPRQSRKHRWDHCHECSRSIKEGEVWALVTMTKPNALTSSSLRRLCIDCARAANLTGPCD